MTLFEAFRATMRRAHYSERTEEAYLHCVRKFLRFHRPRRRREMGSAEVVDFLNHLAVERHTSASIQNQAAGTDLRTIQTLLGHKDLRATIFYAHIVERGPLDVISPLDR